MANFDDFLAIRNRSALFGPENQYALMPAEIGGIWAIKAMSAFGGKAAVD